NGDYAEWDVAEEQRGCSHFERIHTGLSELRLRTRSWTSATSRSVSKPTTYAFGLYVARIPTQARTPPSWARNGRRTNSPRTISRLRALRTSAHMDPEVDEHHGRNAPEGARTGNARQVSDEERRDRRRDRGGDELGAA